MKVAFINPPVIRSKNSCPENNFRFKGILPKKKYGQFRYIEKFVDFYNGLWGARFGVRAGSRWPWTLSVPLSISPHYPFFLGYAAANARAHGYEVVLMDAIASGEYSYDNFIANLEKEHPQVVIIESSTPTIDIDLWLARRIASFSEVCLVGPHVTEQAEQVMRDNPFVKYLIKGEYAVTCIDVLKTRKQGVYEGTFINTLDDLPFPFREYEGSNNYYDPTIEQPKPELQIYASKGCPFKCVYCMWPQVMYKGKYSPRNPEKIADEIKFEIKRGGYKSIFFDDDTFNLGDERISSLCDKLKEIGIPWSMMGRLDTSPKWLFDKMVDSGCIGMRFGVETFDGGVAKNIKKGLLREEVVETLQHLSEKYPKLMIHLTMMKNLPGQTEEIHQEDMKILKEMGYSANDRYRNYQLAACVPFPGTELYRSLQGKVENLEDWTKYDGAKDTVIGGKV